MSAKSQVELEKQLEQRWEQVNDGTLQAKQAFGNLEDWTIQLGERKAFLHPELKLWMWFDRLHNYWTFAQCGTNEAILITMGRLAGIKKLPQAGAVDGWCVYLQGKTLQGPVPVKHLRHWIEHQQLPDTIQVWSPRGTNWLAPAEFLSLSP
ncbi:MAG: hypothetical protein JW726_09265 [Anaerolineales bacterium]|nr:hypothetical protein [Anaerolineales bacterium]